VTTIKNLLEPNKYSSFIALFWTIGIIFMSLKAPSIAQRVYFENADKLVHFTFYFGFVLLWFRYFFYKKYTQSNFIFFLVIFSVLLGISLELIQGYFTTTRQADFWDVLANTLGSLCGILVSNLIFNQKNAKV
jgi:VanZ family protein